MEFGGQLTNEYYFVQNIFQANLSSTTRYDVRLAREHILLELKLQGWEWCGAHANFNFILTRYYYYLWYVAVVADLTNYILPFFKLLGLTLLFWGIKNRSGQSKTPFFYQCRKMWVINPKCISRSQKIYLIYNFASVLWYNKSNTRMEFHKRSIRSIQSIFFSISHTLEKDHTAFNVEWHLFCYRKPSRITVPNVSDLTEASFYSIILLDFIHSTCLANSILKSSMYSPPPNCTDQNRISNEWRQPMKKQERSQNAITFFVNERPQIRGLVSQRPNVQVRTHHLNTSFQKRFHIIDKKYTSEMLDIASKIQTFKIVSFPPF